MGWQPEHDVSLRSFLLDGLSYSEVATAINSEHQTGYSRQACIGRSHRIGIAKSLPARVQRPSSVKAVNKAKADKRKAKRWEANPSLAYRAERLKVLKANRELMIAGGATVTSKAYRRHMPKQRDMTKAELRAQLTTAVQNTADMGAPV